LGKLEIVARVIAGMTISLDGFVADRQGGVGPLYADLASLQGSSYMEDLIAETGAVLMGRRTFEMGEPDSYADRYEFQVPIFVVTHHPPATPPRQNERLKFTFVTDGVEPALAQARAAAGDRAVMMVGGATVARELLSLGLVDELRVDIVPVVLGEGRPLLGGDGLQSLRLQKIGIREAGERTSLMFSVARP
jgi:dihydrofolate reductase